MSDNGNGRLLRGKWQGYTLTGDLDRVRALFERKYGYAPAEVVRAGCILLAGPLNGHGGAGAFAAPPAAHGAAGAARQLALSFEEATR